MALQDSYTTGGTNARSLTQLATWKAQTFTANQNYDITSVKLELSKQSGVTGTFTVSIRAVDGSDQPTGADLTSGTTDIDSLPNIPTGEWREITFGSPYSLTSGTKYAIVLRMTVSTGTTYWFGDSSSPTYAGGQMEESTDSGSTWVAQSGWDMMFETYGSAVSYSELSGTIAVQSVVSGNLELTTISELSGTIAVTSTVGPASLGSLVVGLGTPTSFIKRLIVAGNDEIWYEDI